MAVQPSGIISMFGSPGLIGTAMEPINVEAVYEHGTLRLPCELPLREGQKVTITIHGAKVSERGPRQLIRWTGTQEDLDHLLGPDNHPWADE